MVHKMEFRLFSKTTMKIPRSFKERSDLIGGTF